VNHRLLNRVQRPGVAQIRTWFAISYQLNSITPAECLDRDHLAVALDVRFRIERAAVFAGRTGYRELAAAR
jgi:hypothetical protein